MQPIAADLFGMLEIEEKHAPVTFGYSTGWLTLCGLACSVFVVL